MRRATVYDVAAEAGVSIKSVSRVVNREDGVSPGQACVFYDAIDGQARVLGGGFIRSTVAMTDAPVRRSAETRTGIPARA